MATAVTTTTDTALSTAEEVTKTIRATRTLNIYENDVIEQGRILTLSKEITFEDRKILAERHQAIANSLRGLGLSIVGRERAAAAIAGMFRDGWPLYKIDNAKQVIAAYIHGLQDYPIWAVEAACKALATGQVEDVRPDYPPATARIAQLCEAKIADLRREKAKFQRVLSIKDTRAPAMSDEEREAVWRRHQEWKAKQKPDPVSAEELERREQAAIETRARNDLWMLREYAALGMQPIRSANGMLISPSLGKILGLTNQPAKAEMDQ
jgi:hypothetical protein